jgi:hypothetical protein
MAECDRGAATSSGDLRARMAECDRGATACALAFVVALLVLSETVPTPTPAVLPAAAFLPALAPWLRLRRSVACSGVIEVGVPLPGVTTFLIRFLAPSGMPSSAISPSVKHTSASRVT